MEMPEGWIKLFKPNYADDDFKLAMKECGDLMKEMAEALEKYQNVSSSLSSIEYSAKNVLKKFQEWK